MITNSTYTAKIYCHICDSAYIETTEVIDEPVYRCSMCESYVAEMDPHRELPEENYSEECVIDSGND
jgi:hypothetical protein